MTRWQRAAADCLFLSTPSARRATSKAYKSNRRRTYFYPRPPRGGRPYVAGYVTKKTYDFYPRPPRGGRPKTPSLSQAWMKISIHALREEGDQGTVDIAQATPISIHALREEGDDRCVVDDCVHNISIHALREEGDAPLFEDLAVPMYFYPRPPRGGRPTSISVAFAFLRFLSTPSARRATYVSSTWKRITRFLSTPSARRATYRLVRLAKFDEFLSTPSARRATQRRGGEKSSMANFYPRPPRGGRQAGESVRRTYLWISIHALREEGDTATRVYNLRR